MIVSLLANNESCSKNNLRMVVQSNEYVHKSVKKYNLNNVRLSSNGTMRHSHPANCLACKGFILLFPETAPCTVRAPKMMNNRQATLVYIIISLQQKNKTKQKNRNQERKQMYKVLIASYDLKKLSHGILSYFDHVQNII